MTRVLVTGGAGFLGSHLCERLLADGAEVLAVDNFLTGTPANVEHLVGRDGFRLVKADITDFLHVPGPVDQVLHFASPASPIDYLQLPIETMKVGSAGTLHALGLAKEKGARFLLASTSETYGDPQVHPQPEGYWGHVNPVGPRGVYDEAKRYAEALTMAYHRTHGVDTSIVRIFNSVLADEQLVYDDGQSLHRTTAAELAERLGLWEPGCVPLHGWSVPSFGERLQVDPAETTWFVGHPTEQRCYRVHTRYGREISVTGDHSIFVRGDDGRPVARPVVDLRPGDEVAIAAQVQVPERDRWVVDMLDVLQDVDPWTIPVSFDGFDDVLHQHRHDLVGAYTAQSATRSRQSAWGSYQRWCRQGSVPLGALQACGLGLPLGATVHKGRSSMSRHVFLGDELLWALGLWVAEGSWCETPPKSHYLSWSCDDETLDRVAKVLDRDLHVHSARSRPAPGVRAAGLNASGVLLLALFRHLGFGPGPKGLPGWVLGLPLRRLGHVLEGYRQGDGVHSGALVGRRHVFNTTSTALKDDLVLALSRFGIVPGVGQYSTTFRQRTGERRYPFWRLTTGQVTPWSPLDWHTGVHQSPQARRDGDLLWVPVTAVEEVPASALVYDFSVPGRENFLAGTGVLARNTHGPRMRPNDGRAIPAFAGQALRGEAITVAGDGSQTRSIQYVDDLVEGVLRMLRSGERGPVNIGNPHEVSVLQLAETVRRLVGSDSEIVFIPRPTDDPTVRQPDITLARRVLGWEPVVPFEQGLERTIDWFRTHAELLG